ncbi:MAG: hypothetical protein WCX85_03415 [Bacilli bacterium]|jgi:NADP-dependent 3-hydroxy acid dehydrogenase YdfG|nr:hypothetical protein [Bacilli bacterium]
MDKVIAVTGAANGIGRAMEKNRSRKVLETDAKMMDFLYRICQKFASYIMRRMLNVKRYL